GEQPLFLGLQVEDPGIAGIVAAVEYRDRALREVQVGVVLEAQAQHRELGMDLFVVDAHAAGIDLLIDDGQHGGFLPAEADRVVDLVGEVVAKVHGLGGTRDALGKVELFVFKLATASATTALAASLTLAAVLALLA